MFDIRDVGKRRSMAAAKDTRDLQTLQGLVAGMVADAQLADLEIQYLRIWLSERRELLGAWPARALTARLEAALADGRIDEAERADILSFLQALVGCAFAETGAAAAEVCGITYNDGECAGFSGLNVVHTGTFAYGKRTLCESVTHRMGGIIAPAMTNDTDALVVGDRVSPSWITESYGRKIQRAMEMRRQGRPVLVVSERHWFELAQAGGHVM